MSQVVGPILRPSPPLAIAVPRPRLGAPGGLAEAARGRAAEKLERFPAGDLDQVDASHTVAPRAPRRDDPLSIGRPAVRAIRTVRERSGPVPLGREELDDAAGSQQRDPLPGGRPVGPRTLE